MRKIALLVIISLVTPQLFAKLNTVYKLSDCSTTISEEKYGTLMISDVSAADRYQIVSIFGCGWKATKNIFDQNSFLEYNSNTYEYSDFNYRLMYNGAGSSTFTDNDSYLFELTDTNNVNAKFILFGANSIESTVQMSSTFRQAASDSSGLALTEIPINYAEIYSYFVPLDSTTIYENEYTQSELLYALFFDDGDNWLELILDSDRSNELVGFKYYSDRNSATYTKFIKPNN